MNSNKHPSHLLWTAEVVLAFALAEVPDQESDNDDGHSSSDQSHQKRSHINPAALVIICGSSRTTAGF